MFDFIKSNINYIPPEQLYNNKLLSFETTVNKEGEIKYSIAEYRNIKFKIVDETFTTLMGSFHKYSNCGIHNYNDFDISNLLEVVSELSINFQLNPFLTTIHNLEFGLNLSLPFSPKVLLKSIISYKGKEYELETYNGIGYLLRFKFDHYELKIYNKSMQYNLIEQNILRFEIKVKKMEYFKKRGIQIINIADLFSCKNYDKLENCLIKAISELIIYDNSIKLNKINSQRERDILINGKNPKYWPELKEKGKDIKRMRLRFNRLVLKYGSNNYKKMIQELVKTKFAKISEINEETENGILLYLSQFRPKKCTKITNLLSNCSKEDLSQNNSSNIGLHSGNFEPKCLTCGRDISQQRQNSKFCSEKIFGKDAKRCRNKDSNPRNNYQRKEFRLYNNWLLFDIREFKIAV